MGVHSVQQIAYLFARLTQTQLCFKDKVGLTEKNQFIDPLVELKIQIDIKILDF